MGWGLERRRRHGGVINVVIRVLFNVYVCRCVCMCVAVCVVCVCVGVGVEGAPWHHVVVNHLVILDSSRRNRSNHIKHMRTDARARAHTHTHTHRYTLTHTQMHTFS